MILATVSITVFVLLMLCAFIGMVPPRRRSTWPYAAERQPTAEPSRAATIADAMRTELAGIDDERRADLERA